MVKNPMLENSCYKKHGGPPIRLCLKQRSFDLCFFDTIITMTRFSTNSYKELVDSRPYGKQLESILDVFLPLLIRLPDLRNNSDMLRETLKAIGKDGVTDVVTVADVFVQNKLKQSLLVKQPDWQFWGEEGSDNTSAYDESKPYLFQVMVYIYT